ncbi:MAG: prepilin-type N-terminal cleavage/methylation domain-containing protein [Rickettsiales bacterium]
MKLEKQAGYTLIELSIVIIVIALIIAGLFTSSLLVRQSYLRSVITDLQNYKSSYDTFLLTYKGLPGDITYATKLFPSALCAATDDLCNGNGNAAIERAVDDTDEVKPAMKHLELAGLLNTNLAIVVAGGTGTPTSRLVPGYNVPASAMQGGGYMIINQYIPIGVQGAISIDNTIVSPFDSYVNATYIGKVTQNFDDSMVGGVMRGVDAFTIDTKLDDGNSATGIVRSVNGESVSNCVSGGNYVTTSDSLACVVGYSLQ